MKVTRISELSHKQATMEIEVCPLKLNAWEDMIRMHRPLIQDYFPELNASEREFILTGITPEEWNENFGGGVFKDVNESDEDDVDLSPEEMKPF